MASIDNALTTLARAKTHLDITGTAKNTILTAIILGVSNFVENTYCHRIFKQQAFTQEEYNGKGTPSIWLKQFPVIEGQTFLMEHRTTGLNENEWETLDTEEYYIDYETGEIRRINEAAWNEGYKNYRFTYTAGYLLPSNAGFQDGISDDQDLPYDLELAVLDLIGLSFQRRKNAAIESERISSISVTYAKDILTHPYIKQILDNYKNMSYA